MFRPLFEETGTPEQIVRRKEINTHIIDADIRAAKCAVVAMAAGCVAMIAFMVWLALN